MRPFKFFFLTALAFIILFSLAKIAIIALVFAAIMSVGFFIFRSMINFFSNLSWEQKNQYEYKRNDYDEFLNLSEHPLLKRNETGAHQMEKERIIVIQ